MIVDSSAIVAIHEGEPERERFLEVLHGAKGPRISAATYVESAIVLDRKRPEQPISRLDDLLDRVGIEVVPSRQNRLGRLGERINASVADPAIRRG